MADLWLPGATNVQQHSGLSMNAMNGIRRCTWHVTGDKLYPERPTFAQVKNYLLRVNYDPTIMWDPETGEFYQFFPANRGGYALEMKGIETNKMGVIHVQIETYFSPGYKGRSVFTDGPMVGLEHLMNWLDQLGIPRVAPLSFENPVRDRYVWANVSGHVGHCHAPLNVHGDPQAIDIQKVLNAGGITPEPPDPEPTIEWDSNMPAAFQYNDDLAVFVVEGTTLKTRFYRENKWTAINLLDGCVPGREPRVVKDYRGAKGRLDVFVEHQQGTGHAWIIPGENIWKNEVLK